MIVIAMDAAHLLGERTAHAQPQDDLHALGATALDEIPMAECGERARIPLQSIEEFRVPVGIDVTEALAGELVREPAGAEDDDPQVVLVAQNRAPHRVPELEAACGRRNREVQHVDQDRDHP